MSLETLFVQAQGTLKSFTKRPNDEELLHIYGLYKQAVVGDCNIAEPGFFQFKEKQKWSAWNGKRGMNSNTAKQSYVDFVNQISSRYK
jgi:diazepam-binding inhibitor (GABA receptor modulating acyl-CoA-binding protein)